VRGVLDDEYVEVKSSFYKHRTRRLQGVNVWLSEAPSGAAVVKPLTPEMQEAIVRARAPLPPEITSRHPSQRGSWRTRHDHGVTLPTAFAVPQRVRWFKAPGGSIPSSTSPPNGTPSEREWFEGHDISGSQAQILAVFMGLRDVENQLHEMPFKQLVALSARALHKEGKLRLPDEMLDNARLLEEAGKVAMPLLYGATERNLALKMQRDPEKYGPGLDAATLAVLFRETPVIGKLRPFLAVCEAVGAAAYAKNPAAGVTVTDPLDGATFTWNPPKRQKMLISSGAFKIYCRPPVPVGNGEWPVDKGKLTRRIAPGLV
jgi:hypothetical protein